MPRVADSKQRTAGPLVRILNIERLCWCLGSVDTLNIRTVPFRRHIFADVDAVRVVVSRHGVVCNVPAWRW